MPKPSEVLIDKLEHLARARASGSEAAERQARGALALAEWMARRGRVQPDMQARIFQRDSFVCGYCGIRTIPLQILELLDIPFTRGWAGGQTHEALLMATCCDHIIPVTRGGNSLAENLATACWKCNAIKAEFLLKEVGWKEPKKGPRPKETWRGLTEYYAMLWRAAGSPEPDRHERWMALFSARTAVA
jgi:5-methylcytosine-specific restriction endonuclease McrA